MVIHSPLFFCIIQKFRSEEGKLVFGDFNYPENGENLLGTVEYEKINMFSPNEAPKEVFWLPITTSWYDAATEALKVCQSQNI